jgi:hypothetical protein
MGNVAKRSMRFRFFFGALSIALLAALMIVVPRGGPPAFAAVEDLDAQGTGFPCSSSEGRGGIPYHHVWGTSKNDLIDSSVTGTNGIQWQLGGYDIAIKNYDVVGTWSPYKNGGLTDDNGAPLIEAGHFSTAGTNKIEQVNGQVMDPYGNVYVAIMPKSGKGNAYYVQLLPDNDGDGLGEMRAIANLGSVQDINGGTYIEEDGVPYALISNNFLGGSTYKIPLIRPDGTAIPTIAEQTGWDGASPKDYSWVKEGITYNGTEYTLVALEQTGNQKGTIWLGNTDGDVASITDVAIPTDYKVGGKKESFGASYNYKFEDEKTFLYFSANKAADLVMVELPDPDGNGDIVVTGASDFTSEKIGDSIPTSNNDGAGCPYEPPPVIGDLVAATWPPTCVTDNSTGEGSTVPIYVFNNGNTPKNVKITATINGTTVAANSYTNTTDNGTRPALDGTNLILVAKGNEGLRLDIPILKDQVWAVSIVDDEGKELLLVPGGGTLNADACGDFVVTETWGPVITTVACAAGSNGNSDFIATTINNSGSNIEATVSYTVNGTFVESKKVPAGKADYSLQINVDHGDEVVVTVSADGQADVTSGALTASCPIATTIEAYDCATSSGLIQVKENTGATGYDVVRLNPNLGTYEVVYTLEKSITTESVAGNKDFKGLNGTAIHPTTGVAYGIMSHAVAADDSVEDPIKKYLVRFDENTVQYVFRLEDISSNGTFDSNGNFYWHEPGTNGSYPGNLHQVTAAHIAASPGYADRLNVGVEYKESDDTRLGGAAQNLTWANSAADISHVIADFGAGEKEYILGLGAKLSVTDIATGTKYEFGTLKFADGTSLGSTAFGATYTITDASGDQTVFFSSNDEGFIAALDLSTVNVNDTTQLVEFNNAGVLPDSNVNDGMACPTTVLTTPTEFGDVYGYMWVDFNDDGQRPAIECGAETHVAGYTVTFTNTTQYLDSSGNVVHLPGQYPEVEANLVAAAGGCGIVKWLANLPCKDNSGNTIEWEATFDYTTMTAVPNFTASGYTGQINPGDWTEMENDSDTVATDDAISTSSPFTVTCDGSVHGPDAGIVGDYTFDPTATVDINCATAIVIALNNTDSKIDASYDVKIYNVNAAGVETLISAESATQVVAAEATANYSTAITIPASDTLLYLVIEASGSLNGSVNSERYSQTILNQSANDGVNVLCVQVQAQTDCSGNGESVTLDNTASNQAATFLITPIVNGVDQAQITQSVNAGATLVLTHTELGIPEDSNWNIRWEATGATSGSFPSREMDEMEKDCVDPVFDPDITVTTACTSNNQVLVTYTIDNTASTLTTANSDPATDANTVQVLIAQFGSVIDGSIAPDGSIPVVLPGTSYTGTITVPEGVLLQIFANGQLDGGGYGILGDVIETMVRSCKDYSPVVTIDYECGVLNTAEVSFSVDNSTSEVEIRYKLVATDFAGNATTVRDWKTIPAGFESTIFIDEDVDRNMEYSLVVESTYNETVTANSGWGASTEQTYTDCDGEPTAFDPFAQLVVQCKTTPPVVYLFLDNTASDFHAQYTVNVFDGPDTSSDKNNGLSSTQNVAQDSLVNYAITIPIPDPGEMLTVEILAMALSTGGESITVTSEIYSQAGVNCPADFNVSLTSLPFCGAEAAGVFLNNEFSSYDAEMTVDLMVDDVLTAQAEVTVSAGKQKQQVFRVEDGDSWYISWTATESTNDSTYTGQTTAQTFSPRNDGSCPEEPLFTG